MERRSKPFCQVLTAPLFYHYEWQQIPVDDPAYVEPSKYFKTDNLRLVGHPYAYVVGVPHAFEKLIKYTSPANGFELPQGQYQRGYRYSKRGENQINFSLKTVTKVLEPYTTETNADGSTLTKSKTRYNVYANITTTGWTDVNKSHRDFLMGYRIPVEVQYRETRRDENGYYTYEEVSHRFENFGIQTSAVQDTRSDLITAPEEPTDTYVGYWIEETYHYVPRDPDKDNVISWSKGEKWELNALIGYKEGGYAKFKD